MVTVYSRAILKSSVWGGHAADGADHNEAQGAPIRAIQNQAEPCILVAERVQTAVPVEARAGEIPANCPWAVSVQSVHSMRSTQGH